MGRPTSPFKDHLDAVSRRTTLDDNEDDDLAGSSTELPSYRESEAATAYTPMQSSARISERTAQTEDSYRAAEPITADHTSATARIDERLSDPQELYRYVDNYLSNTPPNPQVRIRGWHWETVKRKTKEEQERVCDFEFAFSFQDLLRKSPDFWQSRTATHKDIVYRGGWRKMRAAGHEGGIRLIDEPAKTLLGWCEDFCASPAKLKVFRVTREVEGLNTEFIKYQIEQIVRSTSYCGHLDISFPVAQRHVDIYTPHPINRWRTSWLRFIFYVTFLWIFTWPILFFMTKWWTVYTVIWRFSNQNSPGTRSYATLSEGQWVQRYKAKIERMVFNRFKGDASHATHAHVVPEAESRRSGHGNAEGDVDTGDETCSVIRSTEQSGFAHPAWGYDA